MANDIAVDGSGNVYVTGYSTGSGFYAEYATIKYDSSGNELWVKSYPGPGITNWAKAIAIDSSSNVYVTGYSHGGATGYDHVTIKYYPDGDTGWVRRYNGPGNGNDKAYGIAVDGSGNVYVTGWGMGLETDRDCATVKYDPDGKRLWACGYSGMPDVSQDEAYTITLDDSGNIYVAGYSQGEDTGYDYVTIKYYSHGDTAWVRKYNGPANLRDVAKSIAVDSSGNVYVTGESDCATGSNYVTIKYDASGNQLWEKRYNGKGDKNDQACAIVVDGSGNVFVTGKSSGMDTNYDYVTIKYFQMGIFVEEVGDERSIYSFNLSQNYPNPFNHKTKIEYYLSDPAWVNLILYNIMGQKIKVLVEEFQTAGSKSLTWDGKDNNGRTVASGIYFYKLQAAGYVQSKKMLFLK